MGRVKFPYLPIDIFNSSGKVVSRIMRPYIPIRLSIHHSNPSNIVDALVDSGSDRYLFPRQWGDMLGINFKKIKPIKIGGIGKVEITAYSSKVNIWVDGQKYPTNADFSPEQQTPLLGRSGFFNLFKEVIFDEKVGCLYITL
ncbi:hypothetical protein HYU95_03975 [Candidatus Daviesbacteria bacterium]|nr:hypothetical protein [Candidatus Daviesbacteria bacterium]